MEDWSKSGVEPSVTEVLADPIVHLVMRRDGVALDDLKSLLHATRLSLTAVVVGDIGGRAPEPAILG